MIVKVVDGHGGLLGFVHADVNEESKTARVEWKRDIQFTRNTHGIRTFYMIMDVLNFGIENSDGTAIVQAKFKQAERLRRNKLLLPLENNGK